MKVAYMVTCPKCGKFWHVIVDANPCYDTCPHCNTEFEVKVEINVALAETD